MAIELNAELRTEKNPRELRRQGFVPGVVYGADVHHQIQMPTKDLQKVLNQATRSSRFEVKVNGESFDTFLREVQYNPLNDIVLHVDFYQPRPDQAVTMNVPILLRGTPVGLKLGGTLFQIREYLPLRGPMERIPEKIEIDVSNMDIGGVLRLGDLDLTGVSILLPLDSTIATVKVPRRVEVVEVEEDAIEGEEGVVESAAGEAAAEAEAASEEAEAPE